VIRQAAQLTALSLRQYEDSAAPLRANLAVNDLASVWWLKLNTFVAAPVAFGVILIGDRFFGYLGLAVGVASSHAE
jgi:hypothetical protein